MTSWKPSNCAETMWISPWWIFMALARQGLCFIPLILILPLFFGINGILFAGPIADFIAFAVSVIFVWREFCHLKRLEEEQKEKDASVTVTA